MPDSTQTLNPNTPLQSDNLSLGYGQECLVEKLSLDIPKGQFTALIGPNGSGKSTILRGFANLLAPQSGNILLDGKDIAKLPAKDIARKMGLLAQEQRAPEGLTVWELVKQGRYPHRTLFSRWSDDDEKSCEEALDLTNMSHMRDRMLDTLSGGQKQRAWISLALAQKTDILLLDEPTTFLDLAHQVEILDLITSLVRDQNKTVLAILHDLNQTAHYADFICLLKQGQVISNGTATEVITEKGIEDAFGIACRIIKDPMTGNLLCLPVSRYQPNSL